MDVVLQTQTVEHQLVNMACTCKLKAESKHCNKHQHMKYESVGGSNLKENSPAEDQWQSKHMPNKAPGTEVVFAVA